MGAEDLWVPKMSTALCVLKVWVVQQARNLNMARAERAHPVKFLIRDRDAKFTSSFDEVFRSERIRIIRTPVQAPRANAFAERFFGTVRRACLDRMPILGRRHLEHVLADYVFHYSLSLQRTPTAPGAWPDCTVWDGPGVGAGVS